jgi:hypothetical protein
MRGKGKSSTTVHGAVAAIDFPYVAREFGHCQGLPSQVTRRLRGKPVRYSTRSAKTGAAPATVNGELLSLDATGVMTRREGETEATTRKPGDLPRQL